MLTFWPDCTSLHQGNVCLRNLWSYILPRPASCQWVSPPSRMPPSVDERTSPVLHKLLWLLIAARPFRIYLTAIAALEHTWEHQKKTQWNNNTQPLYSQWWWTLRKIYRRILIHGKSWNLPHAQTVYTRPFLPPSLNYCCRKGLGTRLATDVVF